MGILFTLAVLSLAQSPDWPALRERAERSYAEGSYELAHAAYVEAAKLDLAYMPHPADLARDLDLVTADFAYARLIGDRKAVEERTKTFDRIVIDQGPRLARWAELLLELIPRVRETFAYANNHYAGFGPETIRDLARRVGAS